MERLALHRFASPWLRNQHVARYRWAAGYAAGKRVLDLASGAGYGSGILKEGDARWVVSADLSPEAFREARLPASGAGALRGVLADASRLPFGDASFDLYASFETIEHVENDRAVVREARRVLAPGGIFICSTPEREVISPGRVLEDRPDNPFHVREYTRPEFETLLRAGFERIEWFGQTPASDGHKARLGMLSARSPVLARKLHQVRNILRLPGEGEARHAPYPLAGAGGWPEVLIAVCGPVS
jgi:SAM-dependent methyltransferase